MYSWILGRLDTSIAACMAAMHGVDRACMLRRQCLCVLPAGARPGARPRAPLGAPHPLGELRGLLAEVASGWGRSGRGSGSQYSRWAPNIAVARRIWLPGASIMEDY